MQDSHTQSDVDATAEPHASDGREPTGRESTGRESDETDASTARTDGGTATVRDAATGDSRDVDYLEREVNIFKPSTPFMRDHLRVVWTMFALWALVVFAPVTATAIAPETMTSITVIGFPLHYALTAIGGPAGALVLSFVYARKRDQLDDEYGIDHGADPAGNGEAAGDAATTDGGVER